MDSYLILVDSQQEIKHRLSLHFGVNGVAILPAKGDFYKKDNVEYMIVGTHWNYDDEVVMVIGQEMEGFVSLASKVFDNPVGRLRDLKDLTLEDKVAKRPT